MSNSANVDQKGRLNIPVTLLHVLKGSGTELYVTSPDGYSVRIYPMQVWNQVEERLERLCPCNRNNQKLLVRAKYFGRAVTMDNQGRVLIPIVLRSSAQMKGAVDIFDYLKLSGSLEPCPITERFTKQSNYSAGRKDAEQTVFRPTIALGNAPEQRGRIRLRNRKMIQETSLETLRIGVLSHK
jgi:MraZ protein